MNGETPARSIQKGSGGTCRDDSWGAVPLGCSAQSGGDWTAHLKTGTETLEGCIYLIYQLVCSGLPCTTPTTTPSTTATTTTTTTTTTSEDSDIRLDLAPPMPPSSTGQFQ